MSAKINEWVGELLGHIPAAAKIADAALAQRNLGAPGGGPCTEGDRAFWGDAFMAALRQEFSPMGSPEACVPPPMTVESLVNETLDAGAERITLSVADLTTVSGHLATMRVRVCSGVKELSWVVPVALFDSGDPYAKGIRYALDRWKAANAPKD